MIEGQDAIEEHQHAVGNVEVIGGVFSNVFELAHDVIRAIAYCSGGERWQAFHGCRAMLLQEFFDDRKNISRAAFDFFAAFDFDFVATRLQPQKWTHAKKRIAANFFSAFDRLEQEGIGLSSRRQREKRRPV